MNRRTHLAALAVLLLATSPTAAGDLHIGFPGASYVLDDESGFLRLRITEDGRTLKAEARGRFQLTDDASDFASLTPGGYIRLAERRRGRMRSELELRGLPDGGLDRQYRVDGTRRDFDAEGRAWLRDAMALVLRHTTFAAESHVESLLRRSGVDGALAAIALMDGDHVKAVHYEHLLRLMPPDPEATSQLVRQAKDAIGSDHELTEFLLRAVETSPGEAGVLCACAEASERIGSDHERWRALVGILNARGVTPEVVQAVIGSADGIGSDHERAEALIAVANGQTPKGALAASFFEAAGGIGSDHERARVLRSVLERPDLSPDVVLPLLDSAGGIGSDHECAQLLTDLASTRQLTGSERAAYLRVARRIGSDHSRDRAVAALGDSAR